MNNTLAMITFPRMTRGRGRLFLALGCSVLFLCLCTIGYAEVQESTCVDLETGELYFTEQPLFPGILSDSDGAQDEEPVTVCGCTTPTAPAGCVVRFTRGDCGKVQVGKCKGTCTFAFICSDPDDDLTATKSCRRPTRPAPEPEPESLFLSEQ